MKEIKSFQDIAVHPDFTAVAGRKIIGTLCSYVPDELILAAGFHPMRLFSSGSDIVLAENHLQSYCCSLVRGILEDSLSGKLDDIHGVVFSHTCDAMQRLSDIWRMKGRYGFFAQAALPAKLNSPSAFVYMEAVLNRLKADLEKAAGRRITDEDLQSAITLTNRIRRSLSAIFDMNAAMPGRLRVHDLYALVKGAMIMDREKAADLLDIISEKTELAPACQRDGKRLIVSGSVCDTPEVFKAIEEAGGFLVGDDLCSGGRWFQGLVDEQLPPMTALAQRYMTRTVCPAKHAGLQTRAENLLSLARRVRADGAVFLILKFCDPHAFDVPYIMDFFQKNNLPGLVVEMDDPQQSLGQLSTRIETFLQMI